MTEVKLLVALSGSKGSFEPGDRYPCSKDEAERLIAKGFAEQIAPTRAGRREKAIKRAPAKEQRG